MENGAYSIFDQSCKLMSEQIRSFIHSSDKVS